MHTSGISSELWQSVLQFNSLFYKKCYSLFCLEPTISYIQMTSSISCAGTGSEQIFPVHVRQPLMFLQISVLTL